MGKWLLILMLVFSTAGYANNLVKEKEELRKTAVENNETRLEYILNKVNVFYAGEQVADADIKTFQILNNYYAKDKNNVYYEGKKI